MKNFSRIFVFVFLGILILNYSDNVFAKDDKTSKGSENGFLFWKNKIKEKLKIRVENKNDKKIKEDVEDEKEALKKDSYETSKTNTGSETKEEAKEDKNAVLFHEGISPVLIEEYKKKSNQKNENLLNLEDFSPLVKVAEKAVVNISGKIVGDDKDKKKENVAEDNIKAMSLGSGFIINKEGYVLTNNHVVDNAKDIKIRFDGSMEQIPAKLLGKDPQLDVALLKIESDIKDYNFLYLGDSDVLNVGESVIAIGNQFQLGQTVTSGIVSATSRQVQGNQSSPFANYIQTDASINPGSSGGPLLNSKGQVVGINTAIFSPSRFGTTGFNIGIGFSTPINRVKKIIAQLKEQGKVDRGALGVIIQQVTEDVKIALNLQEIRGALVANVLKGSVAEEIGIKQGDVIIKFNNHNINDFSELSLRVSETPLGSNAKLEVIRNGEKIYLNTMINKFDFNKEKNKEGKKEDKSNFICGMLLKNIDARLADVLQLEDDEGVLVTDIDDENFYKASDIQRADIIIEIAGQKISNVDDVKNAILKTKIGVPFLILLKRENSTRYVVYKIEEKKENKKTDKKNKKDSEE